MIVRQQVVPVGYALTVGPPKTKAGEHRTVDLDDRTAGTLLARRLAQDLERAAWGDAWTDDAMYGDLAFRHGDGRVLHPEYMTRAPMSQSSCISEHPLFLTAREWDVGAMDPAAVRS